ncbi:MAG: chemotaxis protein CheA [Firmicutes bacterium]|nr:chemotaxis protein CheA [Bacillota bacterium]
MSSGNDILDMYLYETGGLLEQLEETVLQAERAGGFSQEDINEIFRIMHTVKGSSAMMELEKPAEVAHRIEDLFFILRENSLTQEQQEHLAALYELVFRGIDYFRGELERLAHAAPLTDNIDGILNSINALAQALSGEKENQKGCENEKNITDEAMTAGSTAGEETVCKDHPCRLLVHFDEGCGMEHLRAYMLVDAIRDFCSEGSFSFVPSDVEFNPASAETVIEKGFLMGFADAKSRDKAISVVKAAGSVHSYELQGDVPTPENKPVKDAAAEASAANGPKAEPNAQQNQAEVNHKESLISVSLDKLDQLSAIVGEIVIAESMLISSAELQGVRMDTFSKNARQLRKLTAELQDISMSLRMVPVANTFQKMNRIVRDMSKKLGKQAQLVLEGSDTEVDKTIVDSIGDPIMHMIRNSMDHGIEDSPQIRQALGKDPVGTVKLSAEDTGSEVIITVSDDGRGVDSEKVLQKAIQSGLASADGEYSRKDILNFLLMPGFSTNSTVTEFSGRGVGMDVVKQSVEDLGGSVSIASEEGMGMTTTIRIPLTMAIMDGMELSVGDSIFTIPISYIRQSMKVEEADILLDSGGGEMIKLHDRYYPLIRAKELFGIPKGADAISDGILIWLESGDISYCLFADRLLGEQQIVIKPLPPYLNSFDIKDWGIMGCSILGDGNISIILDAANLYAAAGKN